MRPSPSLLNSSSAAAIPRYRSMRSASRLPPPKLPLFRSVVAHPPAPFAVEAHGKARAGAEGGNKGATALGGEGKGDQGRGVQSAAASAPPRPLVGPYQLFYSTAPRPLIPLTASPTNHKLWNPPAPDSAQTRSVDKDESGRLARFAGRFGSSPAEGAGKASAQEGEGGLFGIEGDMSWLEGVTTQSPGTALGKKDVVGPAKAVKKGKK